jgi:cytoskeletal protein CcmA (bactofilin family)
MADTPEPEAPAGPPPILRAGAEWRGVLVLPGPGRIDGCVRGEVVAEGPVWIGETGVVEADLSAESVVVAGRVEGDIRASSRIELLATAEVRGGLRAPSLTLAEGSLVNGCCRTEPQPDAGSDEAGGPAPGASSRGPGAS